MKYRNEVFLPAMAKFEGSDLKQVDPVLEDGGKQIIALFHNECCFHTNDEAQSLWQVQFQFGTPRPMFLIQL